MSQKKIRVPPALVQAVQDGERAKTVHLASVIVGVAVLADVLAIMGLALLVLVRGEILAARWIWAPCLASVALAIVVSGVALDTIRNMKR